MLGALLPDLYQILSVVSSWLIGTIAGTDSCLGTALRFHAFLRDDGVDCSRSAMHAEARTQALAT